MAHRVTDRHAILRAQIHARHIDDVQLPIRMLFVIPPNRFLKLRQRAQIRIALHLLLAFATGQNELTFPRQLIASDISLHLARLDAGLS